MDIPDSHPRKTSLELRHRLVDGFKRGLVAEAGLIAHGRGEAFDYLIGEKTLSQAEDAMKAACALMLSAKNPIISVNGNIAALVPEETVKLAGMLKAEIEVNLFYRTVERESKIADELHRAGARSVFGLEKEHEIPGLGSERKNVDSALWNADVVLLALEDGDRTEAFKHTGKKVVAVDLNPLSRTARMADVTIVDNIVRAFPKMIGLAIEFSGKTGEELQGIAGSFDNEKNLKAFEEFMRNSF